MYLDTIYEAIKTQYPTDNIFVSGKPSTVDEFILIETIRGRSPDITLDLQVVHKPSIRITVSYKTFLEAYSIAESIFNLLTGFSGGEMLSILPETDIISLGKDEKEYSVFYFNCKALVI